MANNELLDTTPLSKLRSNEQRLNKLKRMVNDSKNYFDDNFKRYDDFMRFTFETAITTEDKQKLKTLQKPPVECNIIEAFISRLKGEFSKYEPSIEVRASDTIKANALTPELLKQIEVINGHLKAVFDNSANDAMDSGVYAESIGGGFSAVEAYTEYEHTMSFDQEIKVKKTFEPTLTGFDPLARESHKGDGNYCFTLYPYTRDEFESIYGKEATANMKFTRSGVAAEFNWSYQNGTQQIVLMGDLYFKVKKEERICELSNGLVILQRQYDKIMKEWQLFNSEDFVMQPPIVVRKRKTMIETIERYTFCEDKILSHEKTIYKYLPIVFVDGNSVVLKEFGSTSSKQVTRPIAYHARGIQQLLNFCIQTMGAEIENMVQHKMIVAVEAIPPAYVDAYKNVQTPSNYVYNSFYKDDPTIRLDPPREVQRTQIPSVIENMIMNSTTIFQNVVGSYDGILGVSSKEISGVAIQQGALQSNAAALPYLLNFVRAQTRIAQIIIDLIPKVYKGERKLPIINQEGKREYQVINSPDDPNSISMDYDSEMLQIKIESTVNSAIQKQVALQQLTSLASAIPQLGEVIVGAGLENILDNLEIRNIDSLKAACVQYVQQKQQEAAQQAQQGDPRMQLQQQELALQAEQTEALKQIEGAKIEQQREKAEGDLAIQAAKVANEKRATEIKFMEIMAKLQMEEKRIDMEVDTQDSENARAAVQDAIKLSEKRSKQ
jgi:hypothetical protein